MKKNNYAHDQNRKKPGYDVRAVSPAAGPASLPVLAVNRDPEAQEDELRHGAPGDALRSEGQTELSLPAPESSTLPTRSPSP